MLCIGSHDSSVTWQYYPLERLAMLLQPMVPVNPNTPYPSALVAVTQPLLGKVTDSSL